MLGDFFKRLLQGTPLHEQVPAPQTVSAAEFPGQIFSPARAAQLETFARQNLNYQGDFKSLRSVVDLAACAGQLPQLHYQLRLEPQDFIRRHSESGHEVPANYYTDGVQAIQQFLGTQKQSLISTELLQPFLPDGRNVAQAAYAAGAVDALVAPSAWKHDLADYSYLLKTLWPNHVNDKPIAALLAEATKAKADTALPDSSFSHYMVRDSEEQHKVLNHRGNLEKIGEHRSHRWLESPSYLAAALRYNTQPICPHDGMSEDALNFLFKDDENGSPYLTYFAVRPHLKRFLLAAADDSERVARAISWHARPCHLTNPAICSLLRDALKKSLAHASFNTFDPMRQSPHDEPWLLTAERLGWGDTLRSYMKKVGHSIALDESDANKKTWLELLNKQPVTSFAAAILADYPQLSGITTPTQLLSDFLEANPAHKSSATDKITIANAYSSGIVGDCVRRGLVRELCGVLASRGYLPDPALLQKKIGYVGKSEAAESATLLQAILADDSTWPFSDRLKLIGASALKDSLTGYTERELTTKTDLLRAVGPSLTPDEALILVTKDKRPILPALIKAKALPDAALVAWAQQPSTLFATLGSSTVYAQLQETYTVDKLLDTAALSAQPHYLPLAVRQSKDLAPAVEPLRSVFNQIADDLTSGQRSASTLGFITQDWLMEQQAGQEPLLVQVARAGLFAPARRMLSLMADAPSAAVLAKVGTKRSALTTVLQERGELGQLASVKEWGDDFEGYLGFRQKLEGKKLNADDARFQFYAARLKACHRTPVS